MLTYQNHTVRTSVRKLVEFLLRSGDITTGTAVRTDAQAMQEGSRLHRKLQKAQKATYKSEVPLKMSWRQRNEQTGEEYDLVLEGRADGIDRIQYIKNDQYDNDKPDNDEPDNDEPDNDKPDNDGPDNGKPGDGRSDDVREEYLVLIDEIKCVYRDVTKLEEADLLHLAQAKCYAYMYGAKKQLSQLMIRITYCNIETEDIKYISELISMEELEGWFHELMDAYKLWAEYVVAAKHNCRESIERMQFPFEYRPGQRQMAAVVYRAIEQRSHVFLQAPTGIGKTISALYPALKQMGEGRSDIIFYLTAKTITKTVAEDTLRLLQGQKLKLHSITITAKERICILDAAKCNPESCPRAMGHYDRINQAVYRLLAEQQLVTREIISEYAKMYQVCPYELGLEAAAFSDFVICDYNYVFDPHVNVRGLFGETNNKRSILLVDEYDIIGLSREAA